MKFLILLTSAVVSFNAIAESRCFSNIRKEDSGSYVATDIDQTSNTIDYVLLGLSADQVAKVDKYIDQSNRANPTLEELVSSPVICFSGHASQTISEALENTANSLRKKVSSGLTVTQNINGKRISVHAAAASISISELAVDEVSFMTRVE